MEYQPKGLAEDGFMIQISNTITTKTAAATVKTLRKSNKQFPAVYEIRSHYSKTEIF